jgi:hypothetical protein
MLKVIENQKFFSIDGLFTDSEIDRILSAPLEFSSVGTVVDSSGAVIVDTHYRDSDIAAISRGSGIDTLIHQKLEIISKGLFGKSTTIKQIATTIDIIKYKKGQKLRPHFDWFEDNKNVSGNRMFTIMIGLQNALRGGQTKFPLLNNLEFSAKKGTVYVWKNLVNQVGDKQMIHEGTEVMDGTKIIAVLFLNTQLL